MERELGEGLEIAREVGSLNEIDAFVRSHALELSPTGRFVLKPPFSAAAHGVIHGSAGTITEPRTRRTIESALEEHGRLFFEPWLDRVADFGALAVIDSSGVEPIGIHRLIADARGGFRGIEWSPGSKSAPGLRSEERERIAGAVEVAGRMLAASGYTGAFGIDAFRYRDGRGIERLRPISEINARLTQSIVARLLAEALTVEETANARGGKVRFRVGGEREPIPAARGLGRIVLLRATDAGAPWATLEVEER